jgi:hypothetical protein
MKISPLLSWQLTHSFHHQQLQSKVSIRLFLHEQQRLAVVMIPCNRMLLSFSCAILSPSAHVLDCRITFTSALHNHQIWKLIFKFILEALAHVHTWRVAPSNCSRIQAKIKGIWSTFDHLFSDVIDDDATKTLVIPIVNALHFFVLVVEFNFECPELQQPSRAGPGIMQGTPAWHIVCEARAFFFSFVLHNKNKFKYITLPTDDDLLNHMIGFHQCPGQYNDINCGLF